MKKYLKLFISSAVIVLIFASLQIHLSQAMEEIKKPITFTQSNGIKIAMKVYLGQSLSDLRSELISKKRILPDDIFQIKGSDICRDEEKEWLIRDALVENALYIRQGVPEASWSTAIVTTHSYLKDVKYFEKKMPDQCAEMLLNIYTYFGKEYLSPIGYILKSQGYNYNDVIPSDHRLFTDEVEYIRKAYSRERLPHCSIEVSKWFRMRFEASLMDNLQRKFENYREQQGTAHHLQEVLSK